MNSRQVPLKRLIKTLCFPLIYRSGRRIKYHHRTCLVYFAHASFKSSDLQPVTFDSLLSVMEHDARCEGLDDEKLSDVSEYGWHVLKVFDTNENTRLGILDWSV